jgi:hypothetical protein
MTTWTEFSVAPRIAEIFVRRHVATGNLCMLATNRPDGFPRIGGMPNTAKFRDLLGWTGFGESLVRLWWASMSPSSIDAPPAAMREPFVLVSAVLAGASKRRAPPPQDQQWLLLVSTVPPSVLAAGHDRTGVMVRAPLSGRWCEHHDNGCGDL